MLPEHAILQCELKTQLAAARATLSTTEQEIIELLYYGDLSKAEVGRARHVSATAISCSQNRALAKLKKRLGTTYGFFELQDIPLRAYEDRFHLRIHTRTEADKRRALAEQAEERWQRKFRQEQEEREQLQQQHAKVQQALMRSQEEQQRRYSEQSPTEQEYRDFCMQTEHTRKLWNVIATAQTWTRDALAAQNELRTLWRTHWHKLRANQASGHLNE